MFRTCRCPKPNPPDLHTSHLQTPRLSPLSPILHQPPATTPQVQAQQLEPGASVSAHRDALPFGGDRIATVVLQGSGVVRVGHQSFEARRGAEVRVHTVWEERKGR